jgi:dTDP-4-amino-4,6-dideoxygalactose transaminase
MGPRTLEFERIFGRMIGSQYALAVSNCTVALHLALRSAGIEPGDEVICPSMTFVATVNAIKYVGATPVFCDIAGPEDLTLNVDLIERLITKQTKAILVMHYGGFPCQMSKILRLSKKHNLEVIEDAAHAPLSESIEGAKLGTLGAVGCFSFFSNKNISTGEGGMLVTNRADIYEKAKLLRSHGMTSLSYERAKGHSTSYDVVELGYNYRMDDIRASLGIAQIEKLEADLKKRAVHRSCYLERLAGIEGILIPFQNYQGFVSNYIFPIVLNNSDVRRRDNVRDGLHKAGIQTSIHYPAVHRFSIYRDHRTSLPITEYVADTEITLPLYSKLTNAQIRYISQTLKRIL